MNSIFELIDAEQFAAKIEQASGDVVVKVTTPWSGGCHIIAPMLEAVAQQYPKRLKFYVLRCETRSPLVARYGLNVFPTVLLFRAGDLIDRIVGIVPHTVISSRIRAMISHEASM